MRGNLYTSFSQFSGQLIKQTVKTAVLVARRSLLGSMFLQRVGKSSQYPPQNDQHLHGPDKADLVRCSS
jgi:hypothetical protein